MIIRHISELLEVYSFISANSKIAVDIETNSLNTRKGTIIGIGISNAERAFYLVHQEWTGTELREVLPYGYFALVLEKLHGKQLITWNASFDLRFIKNYFGADLVSSLWSDGMLAKHTVDEERPFALKEVASKIYGLNVKKEQLEMKESTKKNGGTAGEVYRADTDLVAKYCMQDCLLTYKLNEFYINRILQENLWNFFQNEEVMPLYREVTIPMEAHGIKIDLELLDKTSFSIQADLSILEASLLEKLQPHSKIFMQWYLDKEFPVKRTGPFAQAAAKHFEVTLPITPGGAYSMASKHIEALQASEFKSFMCDGQLSEESTKSIQHSMLGDINPLNLQSKYHLKKIFFDELRETPLSRTETGLPQIDEDFLESIKTKYDFVPVLIDFNKLKKIQGSYLERLRDEHEEGIWYPSFHQHRTISGRYGSDAQQFPRATTEGSTMVQTYTNIIRRLLVSRENKVFVDADYESLEPHVFAHVSGDEGLKNIFRNGWDFYSTIAIKTENLNGVSADKTAENYLGKLHKGVRQKAKAYSLGIPYGMGSFALSKTLEVSESEAKRLVDGYLNSFPRLKSWMETSRQKCLIDGKISSEAGRVRHMPKAPNIYKAYGEIIFKPLELWSKYGEDSTKYSQMKYLYSEMKNYVNNSRNFQIQSLGASIVNRACIAINRAFETAKLDAKVVMQVHDQIVVECKKEESPIVQRIVQSSMENVYLLSVPLKAPANIAYNLAESH